MKKSTKITDRVKSYEDACSELGITPIDESQMLANGFTKDEIAYRKLKTITQALNEGWVADWTDPSQEKWIPWFYMHGSSGFVFDDAYYGCSVAGAGDGSRLCFKDEKTATCAGKQFVDLYKEFIL
ncbi:hypothetical protein MASR1M31_03320 [Porphyromonadaceae bacterium]